MLLLRATARAATRVANDQKVTVPSSVSRVTYPAAKLRLVQTLTTICRPSWSHGGGRARCRAEAWGLSGRSEHGCMRRPLTTSDRPTPWTQGCGGPEQPMGYLARKAPPPRLTPSLRCCGLGLRQLGNLLNCHRSCGGVGSCFLGPFICFCVPQQRGAECFRRGGWQDGGEAQRLASSRCSRLLPPPSSSARQLRGGASSGSATRSSGLPSSGRGSRSSWSICPCSAYPGAWVGRYLCRGTVR